MHRTDNSRFLLYIEPTADNKQINPINDELTRVMEFALQNSKKGLAKYSDLESKGEFQHTKKVWRGVHYTNCGEHSSSQDYLLENGMITNSLSVFYLQYYRKSIPKSEMNKVIRLYLFYKYYRNQEVIDFVAKHLPILMWILRIRFWDNIKSITNLQVPVQLQLDLEAEDDDYDDVMN
ncbi:hypothetical protein N9164_09850 [Draconibacterium sp.]|nr:hypothetical protein [Draconibacterium sp.]